MAGGIDWFRWHHGSVTDPKFQLVARKSGVRLPDVLAVWAFVLEKASASDERGSFGEIDCEAVDCLFGLEEGQTSLILEHMGARGLLADGRVSSWEKRQPKRERDADNSTDRTRAYRERQRQHGDALQDHVTPCDATERQETPREEKRREDIDTSPNGDGDKSEASDVVDPCPHQQIIELYHRHLPMGRQVREWTPARSQALRARWREKPKRQSLEWWERFFAYVAESDFLTGKTATPGRKPFEVSLDWLVKAENMAKVIEGAYQNAPAEVAA